jgi:hypothetical protein
MPPDRLWKATERSIARRLQGQRVGPTGRTGPDILAPRLAIEVKERQALPQWLLRGLAQAEEGATDGRVGVLVLHRKGQRHGDDIACLRLRDLERLLGNDPGAPGDEHSLTLDSGGDHP